MANKNQGEVLREKALLIKGPLEDLSDVLRIARTLGKQSFRTEKVNVKPVVLPYGNSSYMVVVASDGAGCSKPLGVGMGTKKKG